MNDSPGWASPGSAPSDEQGAAVPRPSEPADDGPGAPQWSAEQPPAGQWSPPAPPGPRVTSAGSGHAAHGADEGPHGSHHSPDPGPHRQQNPGQNWGQNWGAPPDAAKPGIIPLRPLGVGEILDGAVSTIRTHWRTVLGISLAVSVVSQLGIILVQRFLLPDPVTVDPDATDAEIVRQSLDSAQSALLSTLPVSLFTMIATLFVTSVLTVVVSRSVLGRPVTLSEAWAEARPQVPKLIGLTLLLAVISVAILAVGLLPGLLIGSDAGAALALLGFLAAGAVVVWLMVRFTLAAPALMLERQSVTAAMRRSAKLVDGAWWRMFGVLILTYLLVFILTMVIAIPFTLIATAFDGESLSAIASGETPAPSWTFLVVTGLGDVVVSTLMYPFSAGVAALLYIDRRIRREALDLDLARAAGVPGYDTTGG
ncbi:glycerophosphoryl diester phosphodiesterase membrane domain-containing protein [uncultured Streptomyces sp.]|uniref:glycerophosphoryl diester phosphodiesterase membrane domain-containing protein n=1 Tax=uncultured Streptomyces sp. TaxID=174707 RepID=UPI002635D41B|nr:glycerophosphoryl diester phosphodiesterase membrane domain-containing protein [uncultured Streptomyces sp.]